MVESKLNIPPDLALALHGPRRLLQLFPASWKRNYLLRHSGGREDTGRLSLPDQLLAAKRILIVWPERGEDLLMAFPAIESLRRVAGEDAVFAHLAPSELNWLLADFFPAGQILSWTREGLAWHAPAVQALVDSLQTFSPEMSINLMDPCPSVLRAAVRASGAQLRLAMESTPTWPYANIRVQTESETPLAGRYFRILDSWRYAGFEPSEQWPVLPVEAEQRQDGEEAWKLSGAAPESTWLFAHDVADVSRTLDDDLYEQVWEQIQSADSGEVSIALALLNAPSQGIGREGRWRDVPLLKASGLLEFSALAGLARGVAAFQGIPLHIASFSDVRCLALLREDETAYDTSAWNKAFTSTSATSRSLEPA